MSKNLESEKSKSVLASLAILALFSSATASSAELKIAVVDMQKALQTVEEGKKAKSTLETAFNAKKKELQTEEASIKKMGEEFRKQAAVMNEDARGKKQAELQERIMKFQENTARSQADIQQKERDLTQPIINRLRGVIAEIAQSKSLNLVLEKNENTVLYSLPQDDLTQEVITTFNKKSPTK